MTHDDDDMSVMVIDGGLGVSMTLSSPCLVVSVGGCVPVAGKIARKDTGATISELLFLKDFFFLRFIDQQEVTDIGKQLRSLYLS